MNFHKQHNTLSTNRFAIAMTIALVVVLSGCSTKKNTTATRAYHSMCTKYNVGFNADNAYNEGIKAINTNNSDDFTNNIPLFCISNHSNTSAATSQMERTIEKCRKAIKKHSITKRPKRDKKRWNNPKYQYFYNQEEYVQGVKDAWILLAKAEMHKGAFSEAAATLSYVQRHFPSDKKILCEARIWQARAYGELGWLYEAQEVFDKIDENTVSRKLSLDYTETKAYLLLLNNQPYEALPYLELALKKEKDAMMKSRLNYLIGQIYYAKNQPANAVPFFKGAIKTAQSYPLEFNARLMLLMCDRTDVNKNLKKLNKMLRSSNNKEYKDQIYTTIGNIHLAQGDTIKAIEAFKSGINESTRNGVEKAHTLITLGDLYYGQRQYVEAHPCFSEAANLISTDHDDYRRVTLLGETLGELATYHNTVELQDSLQHLATLTEEEQRAIVDKIIEEVIAEEERIAKEAKEAEEKGFVEPVRGGVMPPLGVGASTEWYFYNDQLKRQGAALFQQKWGKRTLEDNWRRTNKTASLLSNMDSDDETFGDGDDENGEKNPANATDNTIPPTHQPEYYLAQIPKTEEDIAASNLLIADALYGMGKVLDEKLHDYPMSLDSYNEFHDRFGDDQRILESLYSCYRICGKQGDTTGQEHYKQLIISRFPDSQYAAMLSRPNYVDEMQAMLDQQDSIYLATYVAYSKGEFATVRQNYQFMKTTYPLSTLMPKFTFLNTLTTGKTESEDAFYEQLTQLVADYPQSDVTPMCKDILALMGQGREAKQGSTHGSIIEKRETETKQEISETLTTGNDFTFDNRTAHTLVIILRDTATTALNSLLYDIAAFNFTKFMIKSFDIARQSINGTNTITISALESYTEAQWYENMLLGEPTLEGKVTLDKIERFIISDDNLQLIESKMKSWNDYRDFISNPENTTTNNSKNPQTP